MKYIWVGHEINGSLQALLSIVTLNLVLVAITVGLFWTGVFVARTLGRKISFSLAPLGFALPKGGSLKGIFLGLAVGVGAVFVGGILNAVSTVVFESLGYSAASRVQQPFMQSLKGWVQDSPTLAIPAIVFTVVIFGPFVEELVFRGTIFNGLYRLARLAPVAIGGTIGGREITRSADLISFAAAAIVSSAFFALLHLEPVLLPALLTLAIALCALFRWSGSLLPSFVAHATFNSFATTLVILSGLGVFELPV